jgi:hypothetical protein
MSEKTQSASAHEQVGNTPIAFAVRTEMRPVDDDAIESLAQPFRGQSVAERYRGAAWLTDSGGACILLIASSPRTPKLLKKSEKCAFIAWRWNDAPTPQFSLTLMFPERSGNTERPHARWMRSAEDLVVQAIRSHGEFLVCVSDERGDHSGWFKAVFHNGVDSKTAPSTDALERLWTFPTIGIPHSSTKRRFDPQFKAPEDDKRDDEIPVWADPEADFWKILSHDGPWAEDLSRADRARTVWARLAWQYRYSAAGYVQVVIDKQKIDGEAPFFDAEGRLLKSCDQQSAVQSLVTQFPLIGRWLAALGGPDPNAHRAQETLVEILRTPPAIFETIRLLFTIIATLDNDLLATAVQTGFDAALADSSITGCGISRPYLANTGTHQFELKSIPVDFEADLADIECYWRTGLELLDVIDIGDRIGPADFPAPYQPICEALERVSLEGTIEDAEILVQELLLEAKQARQWSVPWGARIEVHFGPFVAMRIFEREQEFSCHFLDEEERYFHVAVGLRDATPNVAVHRLVRKRHDDGEMIWNEDAELSLKLIAAATIRDFLVVEDRERVFGSRKLRRRVQGRDIKTIIYLPRVRYTGIHPSRFESETPSGPRAAHSVSHHLRKTREASAAQRFLAMSYGITIPQGFTFVRPHQRGLGHADDRIRIYRSRSASRMIFDAVDKAPDGSRPAWFDFEKDCARLLRSRQMQVVHQAANRDGDGGVDLYAITDVGESWIVQCKCWAMHRLVGPNVVRELEGAIRLADAGSSKRSKGLIITTSSFTDGSRLAASDLGFELIDGSQFSVLLKSIDI